MSKPSIFLSLLTICIFVLACEAERPGAPEVGENQSLLHYDGPQLSAPFLTGREYEAAIRLTTDKIDPVVGGQLVGVQVYISALPNSARLRVYKSSVGNRPDSLLVNMSMGRLASNSWNNIDLASPIPLELDEYWIAIAFTHNQPQPTIGCDAGPADPEGGDWLYDDTDGEWRSLRTRSDNQVNINWNIRGVAEN